jgi:hypothetical protein
MKSVNKRMHMKFFNAHMSICRRFTRLGRKFNAMGAQLTRSHVLQSEGVKREAAR